MSIILKGIDLPSKGEDVTIEINSSGYVRAYSTVPMVYDHDIQAIQIPKGHGYIKDVSNIIKKFDENIALAEAQPMVIYANAFLNDALVWSAEYEMIKDDIDNAPTILEAEE